MKFKLLFSGALVAATLALTGCNDSTTSSDTNINATPAAVSEAELISAIRSSNPQLANAPISVVKELSEYGMVGLYEIILGGQTMVVDASGQYAVVGDLFALSTVTNLSAERREQNMERIALARLPQLNAEQVVTLPAANEVEQLGTVWVFTDPTCPYCQRFHDEADAYAQAGVEVIYVPYPRSGLMSGGRDYDQLTRIMCADDKAAAMHAFKTGTNVDDFNTVTVTDTCREHVANGFDLGQEIGISGTPFIVLSQGGILPGYNPAERIIARLRSAQ
ncbi:MAG: DsbC family protein [Aliidiomarina sp.]|uniref:DsbC family protein n=1 Tax=Aliidiomarina sp. TaxID=1872439 RepID=UPI0025B99EA1|nr:DsbC family protein [Aliidiomarina sp.]MCH8502544.1 DsbC family protein [Aliidiomarina sp.]